LLAGTGGTLQTQNGLTPTGVLASGWFGERATGSSTATAVFSKEMTRADQLIGTGQIIQVDWTATGVNPERYRMEYRRQGFGIQNNIVIGAKAYIQATFELLEPAVNWLGVAAAAGRSITQGSMNPCGPIYLRGQPWVLPGGTTTIFVDLDVLTDGTQADHVKGSWRDVRVCYQ
jgi:hypothetical protein